ncbi:type IV pilus modification PilV family protein [Photobacterium leiognathi]|uniref:type IV pilus modification PilV family protein n=1 Tax=Photobacterium leiognathi TaxID=553611 RepID=UPI0029819132|nr:type II secretion system protein [Photobacterium leiognathi]
MNVKKVGFALIEVMLAIALFSIAVAMRESYSFEKSRWDYAKEFGRNLSLIVGATDKRILTDGYDISKWSTLSWSSSDYVSQFLKQEHVGINSTDCGIPGSWDANDPDLKFESLIPCNIFPSDRLPYNMKARAEITNLSGRVGEVRSYFAFTTLSDAEKYRKYLQKAVNEARIYSPSNVTGTYKFYLANYTTGAELFNFTECVNAGADCGVAAVLDTSGLLLDSRLLINGANSMLAPITWLFDGSPTTTCAFWERSNLLGEHNGDWALNDTFECQVLGGSHVGLRAHPTVDNVDENLEVIVDRVQSRDLVSIGGSCSYTHIDRDLSGPVATRVAGTATGTTSDISVPDSFSRAEQKFPCGLVKMSDGAGDQVVTLHTDRAQIEDLIAGDIYVRGDISIFGSETTPQIRFIPKITLDSFVNKPDSPLSDPHDIAKKGVYDGSHTVSMLETANDLYVGRLTDVDNAPLNASERTLDQITLSADTVIATGDFYSSSGQSDLAYTGICFDDVSGTTSPLSAGCAGGDRHFESATPLDHGDDASDDRRLVTMDYVNSFYRLVDIYRTFGNLNISSTTYPGFRDDGSGNNSPTPSRIPKAVCGKVDMTVPSDVLAAQDRSSLVLTLIGFNTSMPQVTEGGDCAYGEGKSIPKFTFDKGLVTSYSPPVCVPGLELNNVVTVFAYETPSHWIPFTALNGIEGERYFRGSLLAQVYCK